MVLYNKNLPIKKFQPNNHLVAVVAMAVVAVVVMAVCNLLQRFNHIHLQYFVLLIYTKTKVTSTYKYILLFYHSERVLIYSMCCQIVDIFDQFGILVGLEGGRSCVTFGTVVIRCLLDQHIRLWILYCQTTTHRG